MPLRRHLLKAAMAGVGLALVPRSVQAARLRLRKFATNPFTLGVASGYPTDDGMVLWTRLAPNIDSDEELADSDFILTYEIATDPNFSRRVQSGTVVAMAADGHSVHLEISGLPPGREFYYRFRAGDHVSPIGRTWTAHASGSMQSILRISVASCQHYEQGYFHAYRDMVSRGSDLIIHLGDYIYEGNTATPVRAHDSNVECKTLADYRRRYAWYRADPLLQEAHAHCPWLVTHDDHELDNDYADLQSENPAEQAEFAARRAAAYQAYWENMPLPLSAKPQGPDMALYMSRQFGDLLAIHMLDERQYRSPQACPQPPRRGGTRVIVEQCADWRDPDRTILGSAQEQWLAEQLATSKTRWNLLGQGVVFTWIDEDPGPKTLNWNDSWAGYPAARRRMLETISTSGASNPVILGGDIHAFIAGDQRIDPRDSKSPIVTSEFVTTSVTSGPPPKKVIEAYNRSDAIGVHYAERDYRGYLRLEVSAERLNAEMIGFASVRENEASPTTLAKFVIDDGQRGIQRL